MSEPFEVRGHLEYRQYERSLGSGCSHNLARELPWYSPAHGYRDCSTSVYHIECNARLLCVFHVVSEMQCLCVDSDPDV